MPTTQKDFDALGKELENKNVEEIKKILQNFDITATNDHGSTCLMYCMESSSPEVVNLIFKKIDQVGDPELLKSQLLVANDLDWNCFLICCATSSSPEVMRLVLEKIVEADGDDLLKTQLSAPDGYGRSCLMYGSEDSSSAEVVKLVATVLFSLDLFQEQYMKMKVDNKHKLKIKTGIDSSSWTPSAASLAEVKELLQRGHARKKAKEEAVAKKKAEEEAAAKKKAEEEASSQQPAAQQQIQSSVTFGSAPPSRCFKRGVSDKNFEDSVNALLSIKEAPANRPDLNTWIPDKEDASNLLHYLKCNLADLKERPAIQKLIAECGLTDDDIKILHSYKIQNPYPVYLWLNGWLGGDRRDDFVKEHVAPFFVLLYRAMEKLPKLKTVANRAIKVNSISALKNTYDNHEKICAPGKVLSFWGFSSFSTKSDVINREEFVGKPSEEAILYSCGELEGVDMEPFAPKGLNDESEILPLCPCVLEVVTSIKVGQKLVVAVKQVDHSNFAYVAPLSLT